MLHKKIFKRSKMVSVNYGLNILGKGDIGRDPCNQNSNRSDREKRTTSKGGPVFSKLFRLDRTDPLSFGPKFPEILVEWIAPLVLKDKQWEIIRYITLKKRDVMAVLPTGCGKSLHTSYHRFHGKKFQHYCCCYCPGIFLS